MATDTAKRHMTGFEERGLTEQVTYRPVVGDARVIDALVDRDGRDDAMNAATPAMRVTVLDDETDGITAVEIDTGGDRIDVAERIGGAATSRHIQRIAEQDGEFVTVEVK